jgi:hypothetical protein
MGEEYVQIPEKGMTAEEVLTLWSRGELFRKAVKPTGDELLARCRQEVLSYVSAIDKYAAPEWRPTIHKLWTDIVGNVLFAPSLVIQKGRNRGHLNKYFVTNIVFHMRALDIYQCDNLLELHKQLEDVQEKNGIYKAAVVYCLTREQRIKIRELAQKVTGQK